MNRVDEFYGRPLTEMVVPRNEVVDMAIVRKGRRVEAPANSIFAIHPTRRRGIWAFTDERAGLDDEPFVGAINDMIDHMVKDIPKAHKGFTLYFASIPIPDHQMSFTLVEEGIPFENEIGADYTCDQLGITGWLCPALFCYFDAPPKKIYVRAEAARK